MIVYHTLLKYKGVTLTDDIVLSNLERILSPVRTKPDDPLDPPKKVKPFPSIHEAVDYLQRNGVDFMVETLEHKDSAKAYPVLIFSALNEVNDDYFGIKATYITGSTFLLSFTHWLNPEDTTVFFCRTATTIEAKDTLCYHNLLESFKDYLEKYPESCKFLTLLQPNTHRSGMFLDGIRQIHFKGSHKATMEETKEAFLRLQKYIVANRYADEYPNLYKIIR